MYIKINYLTYRTNDRTATELGELVGSVDSVPVRLPRRSINALESGEVRQVRASSLSRALNGFDREHCSPVKTQSSSVSLLQPVNPGSDLPTVNLVEQGHGSGTGPTETITTRLEMPVREKWGVRSGGGGFCRRAPER
jgi:hypothetical protein